MFRKARYLEAGGYRTEFLFSQDSDLWLRLAAISRIAYLPSVRYFHRKALDSTSSARRAAQARFAELAHLCRAARDRGEPEGPWLEEANALSRRIRAGTAGVDEASGVLATSYLLGSQLARNRDPRARSYLYRVLASRPWHWRAWARLVQSWLLARRPAE
jgi:hypothetical protein